MALFNYATRELSAKVVYYGPGLSGKTTNIEMVHHLLKPEQKGRLISLPTETDRTLFFDFLPLDLGQIKGFKVRFHLYTVPGQVSTTPRGGSSSRAWTEWSSWRIPRST